MTAAEYLAWERAQADKHEFHDGEVFAMAGGSPRHNYLATAIAAELRAALDGGPCVVLSSDQRVASESTRSYVYPDAVVVCDAFEVAPHTDDVLANPAAVVEVLSPTTEGYDRGDKWRSYQALSSLVDYVLVAQSAPRVEHFGRDADGTWRYRVFGPGETVELASGARLSVDAVYRGAFELPGG